MLSNAPRLLGTAHPGQKHRKAKDRKASSTAGAMEPTVLVVDDEPSVLSALARLIRSAGLKVSTFDQPSALMASEVPTTNACMLVDVHLPEMNGIQLCETLSQSGRGLPAIIMTGREDGETRRLIAQAHPVAALFKPIDERTLLEAIYRALNLSKGGHIDS
jgi:FixJ family two-component response regulator